MGRWLMSRCRHYIAASDHARPVSAAGQIESFVEPTGNAADHQLDRTAQITGRQHRQHLLRVTWLHPNHV